MSCTVHVMELHWCIISDLKMCHNGFNNYVNILHDLYMILFTLKNNNNVITHTVTLLPYDHTQSIHTQSG